MEQSVAREDWHVSIMPITKVFESTPINIAKVFIQTTSRSTIVTRGYAKRKHFHGDSFQICKM